jgi:hypothetical protein
MENNINQEATTPNHPRARSTKLSDAEVAEMLGSLKKKEILLQAGEAARREMEERYEAQLRESENRRRELEDLVLRREAELRATHFRANSLAEQMSQVGRDKDRMISEVARLNAELKEKRLILARQERDEWQSIGWRNGFKRRLGKLAARFSKSADEEKLSDKNEEQFPFTSR